MSKTNRRCNKRKKALKLLEDKMAKEGYKIKKQVRNSITFRHKETGKKIKKTLVVE